jgi:hypothetical protein
VTAQILLHAAKALDHRAWRPYLSALRQVAHGRALSRLVRDVELGVKANLGPQLLNLSRRTLRRGDGSELRLDGGDDAVELDVNRPSFEPLYRFREQADNLVAEQQHHDYNGSRPRQRAD